MVIGVINTKSINGFHYNPVGANTGAEPYTTVLVKWIGNIGLVQVCKTFSRVKYAIKLIG